MQHLKANSGQEAALAEFVEALRSSTGAETSVFALETASSDADLSMILPRCALCCLAERSAERSLRSLFAEFVNDPMVRAHFRETRGFCRQHTPMLSRCGDALGVAILYSDLADETRRRWRSAPRQMKHRLFSRWFAAAEIPLCPACAAEADSESRYSAALGHGLQHDASLWTTLTECGGLCTRHVERISISLCPADAARFIELECDKMDVLFADLEEFVRKNDYRFRGEAWGQERDAWRRALIRLRRP